ncbi:MAG: hypothetical protein ACFB22_04695 [Rhodothalassiaceae bacterium]
MLGWLGLALLPPLVLAWQVFSHSHVRLDHRLLFTLGMCFYASLPAMLFVIASYGEMDDPFITVWLRLFALLSETEKQVLPWTILGLWTAFLAGDMAMAGLLARRAANRRAARHAMPASVAAVLAPALPLVIRALALVLVAFVGLLTVQNRHHLLGGYDLDQVGGFRGPIQLAIGFLTLLLLIVLAHRRMFSRNDLILTAAALGVSMLLSVLLGTRQNVLTAVMALLAFRSCFGRPLTPLRLISALGLIVVLGVAVAVVRLPGANLSYALVFAFTEPAGTFISLLTMTAFNALPFFSTPDELLVSALNLIPSAIWPGKADFLEPFQHRFIVLAPLGARHLGVSLISNFGIIGAPLLLAVMGAALRLLKQLTWRPDLQPTYAFLAGVVALDLWRNPLQVSVAKNMIQTAVIFPLGVYVLAGLILFAVLDRGRSIQAQRRL